MYIKTSFEKEFDGIIFDVQEKFQKKFEVTWFLANSKGNAIRKSKTPRHLRYFIAKVYADHGYMVLMLFQNAKDKNAEMKRLDSKNKEGKLDPNLFEYASGKFIRQLKKVEDVWYRQVSNSQVPANARRTRVNLVNMLKLIWFQKDFFHSLRRVYGLNLFSKTPLSFTCEMGGRAARCKNDACLRARLARSASPSGRTRRKRDPPSPLFLARHIYAELADANGVCRRRREALSLARHVLAWRRRQDVAGNIYEENVRIRETEEPTIMSPTTSSSSLARQCYFL